MVQSIRFDADPDIDEVEIELSEMKFHVDHPAGGRSEATVLVPTAYARRSWAIERARVRAAEVCAAVGGGEAMTVCVSLGW